MGIFRSDQQVALNDLLVACEKTADHYRDSADFLDGLEVSDRLRAIADRRDRLAERLRETIQSSGDLPSAPDEDRESVEKLFHRVHASLSHDEIRDVLRQRLDAEDQFERLIREDRVAGWTRGIDDLVRDIEADIAMTKKAVSEMFEAYCE